MIFISKSKFGMLIIFCCDVKKKKTMILGSNLIFNAGIINFYAQVDETTK